MMPDAHTAPIDGLHDITVPEAVSLFPATVAWLAVCAALVLFLVWITLHVSKKRGANLYRREALARLKEIRREADVPGQRSDALQALAPLLKRTALSAFPRQEVASLSGKVWTTFLTKTGGGDAFRNGAGSSLRAITYGKAELDDVETDVLLTAARRWIRDHPGTPRRTSHE